MKRGLWLLIGVLLIASLVVAACAPAAPATPTATKAAESKPAAAQPAESKPAATQPAEAKPAEKPAEKAAEKPAAAAPVVLKAVCFLAKNHPVAYMVNEYVKRVNEQGQGKVRIDYLGGPEVIPPLEQADAVIKGAAVQMGFNVTAYYAPLGPELDVLHMTEVTPMDERKPGGMYDFMVERHKKIGLYYLGRWSFNQPFYLYTNKKVDTPKQLAGQKMRTTALYDPFMKALGIVPITMPFGDIYTSIERGVIDGYGWPALGIMDAGLNKVTKYRIEPSFYEQNNTILVNLKTWESLPKDVQDLLKDVAVKLEPDTVAHFAEATKKELEAQEKGGVQVIKFSPEDAKWYRDLAYKSQWDEIEAKVKDPALVAQLKELVKKK